MKFPIIPFIFGSVMMLAITGLVYSYIGDSKEACKDNTDQGMFSKCLQVVNDIKSLVRYAWVAYLIPIPLFFVINYKREKKLTKRCKHEGGRKYWSNMRDDASFDKYCGCADCGEVLWDECK